MPGGKDSVQINVTISKRDRHIYDEIKRRTEQLGPVWSHSAYGLEIWRWWLAQGAPAVNAQDQAMIIAKEWGASHPKKPAK